MNPEPAAPIRATILRIGVEGDAVGRADPPAPGSLARPLGEAPVYVRGALPGETIAMRALVKRGEGWAGELDAVIAPSPERVVPPCPHFGTCGGCALQQWNETGYRGWKTGLLRQALARGGFGGGDGEAVVAPLAATPPGARRRMDLAIRRAGGGIVLGLHAARGAHVVDMETCLVLHPALVALIAPLRAALRGLSCLRREGSAVVNLLDSGPDLLIRGDGPLAPPDRAALASFAETLGLARISWAIGTGSLEPACTLRPATTHLSGAEVHLAPGAFLQASAEGEAAIAAACLAHLPKLTRKARIADLYAGSGTISFALARHARVDAFEGEASAVATLRQGAAGAGLAGRLTATLRDLARQPLLARELSQYAFAVLDPPFAGALPQIREIAASNLTRLAYVSCNPATLGRDLEPLRAAGFRLLAATPIDQFLWSPRLESVVVLAR